MTWLPDDFPALPALSLKGASYGPPVLVEVWAEKTTMNDVLVPLVRRYGANLVTGAGEMSLTAVHSFLARARAAGVPARILYVSDFDPAGRSMPVAVARKIEFALDGRTDLDIKLNPIVLTPAQCREYRLPRTPIKESERRGARFESRFGEGATELDALEALHPGALARIVGAEIERYVDPDARWKFDYAASEYRAYLREIQRGGSGGLRRRDRPPARRVRGDRRAARRLAGARRAGLRARQGRAGRDDDEFERSSRRRRRNPTTRRIRSSTRGGTTWRRSTPTAPGRSAEDDEARNERRGGRARARRRQRAGRNWLCRCPAHEKPAPQPEPARRRHEAAAGELLRGLRSRDVLAALRGRGLLRAAALTQPAPPTSPPSYKESAPFSYSSISLAHHPIHLLPPPLPPPLPPLPLLPPPPPSPPPPSSPPLSSPPPLPLPSPPPLPPLPPPPSPLPSPPFLIPPPSPPNPLPPLPPLPTPLSSVPPLLPLSSLFPSPSPLPSLLPPPSPAPPYPPLRPPPPPPPPLPPLPPSPSTLSLPSPRTPPFLPYPSSPLSPPSPLIPLSHLLGDVHLRPVPLQTPPSPPPSLSPNPTLSPRTPPPPPPRRPSTLSAINELHRNPYASAVWLRLRRAQLRCEPLCRLCKAAGRIEPATTVDHKVPHKGDMTLFADPGNLQSLCAACHSSVKQSMERRGQTEPPSYSRDVGPDGYPLDPRHPFYQPS